MSFLSKLFRRAARAISGGGGKKKSRQTTNADDGDDYLTDEEKEENRKRQAWEIYEMSQEWGYQSSLKGPKRKDKDLARARSWGNPTLRR